MKRALVALRCLLALTGLVALSAARVAAQPTLGTAEVLAIRDTDGAEAGTEKTWFIFRLTSIFPAANQHLVAPAGAFGAGPRPVVYIDVFKIPNQFDSARIAVPMRRDFVTGGWIAFIRGSTIANGAIDGNGNGSVAGPFTWEIAGAQEDTATPPNHTEAYTALGNVRVYPSRTQNNNVAFTITPVDLQGNNDKAPGPGQQGNGLRTNPESAVTPNDGGSAHQYIWRVRLSTLSGLPPEFYNQNGLNAYDGWASNSATQRGGVMLTITLPDGVTQRLVPMEIEPGQAVDFNSTYPAGPNGLLHPQANAAWKSGVYFRYTVLPDQYQTTVMAGDVSGAGLFHVPDATLSQFLGGGGGGVGRPYANLYAAFGAEDPSTLPFGAPLSEPYYGRTAGLAGQYTYYYTSSIDFRPDTTPWGGGAVNFFVNGWNGGTSDVSAYNEVDHLGANEAAYRRFADADGPYPFGPNPARGSQYQHPYVTPLISDGHWSDDIADNALIQGHPAYVSEPVAPYDPAGSMARNARRSRATTKTRVRFQCRVVHVPRVGSGSIGALEVRLWLGTPGGAMQSFRMVPVPPPAQADPTQAMYASPGVVYYFDTIYPPGAEGKKVYYIEADDGTNRAIWPRRPEAVNDPWGRFVDGQGASLPNRSDFVAFSNGAVDKNYMMEPWVNQRPTLSNPVVNPPNGLEGQSYTYSVTYRDLDNDPPVDAWVIIDNDGANRRYKMTVDPADANKPTSQGVKYTFTLTQLPSTLTKKHNYFFQFRDNWAPGAPIRREYGEWVTLPPGDDFGNPSSVIEGPTISGNNPPALSNAIISASDQGSNPATLYDFFITYKDADNDAPANLKVFIDQYDKTTNNKLTNDSGTSLVRVAGGNPNYSAGEQYHLASSLRLPVNQANAEYRLVFAANDGKTPLDVKLVTVGTGDTSNVLGSAKQLTNIGGLNFSDPNQVSQTGSRFWEVDPATLFIWLRDPSATPTDKMLTLGADYTLDATNGILTLQPPAFVMPNGAVLLASYRYGEVTGPTIKVNNAPVLSPLPGNTDPSNNFLTCVPLDGDTTTQFKFTIRYTDADNQRPWADDNSNGVMLSLDGGKQRIKLTMDPTTIQPVDYRNGITYLGTTTLALGNHNYHFEASDGANQGRFPTADPDPLKAELQGPNVEDLGTLTEPTIQPFTQGDATHGRGGNTQLYIFTVTYTNKSNLPPTVPIELQIRDTAGALTAPIVLNQVPDPNGNPPDYTKGVLYRNPSNLTAPTAPVDPGDHQVTFAFRGRGAGTAPLIVTVNGLPVLSQVAATAPFVTPNNAYLSGTTSFSVTYTDLNGDPPVDPVTKLPRIKVFVEDSSGGPGIGTGKMVEVTKFLSFGPDPKTYPVYPGTAGSAMKTGVVFNWVVRTLDLPDATPAAVATKPNRRVQFQATDDFNPAEPVPPVPFNADSVNGAYFLTLHPAAPPVLAGTGAAANGTLSATIGKRTDTFTYSVKYSHADGTAPVAMLLHIYDATGATEIETISPANGLTQVGSNYVAGVNFEYTTKTNELPFGGHKYKFEAADYWTQTQVPASVTLPASGQFTGPYVNNPPTLAGGTVYTDPANIPAPGAGLVGLTSDTYTFRVFYSDVDATRTPIDAAKIVVKSDMPGFGSIPLTFKSGDPMVGNGAMYESAGLTLPPTIPPAGHSWSYHFEAIDMSQGPGVDVPANTDLDAARAPATGEYTGLEIRRTVALNKPADDPANNDQTLTPLPVGANGGTYTYSVYYSQGDGTPPSQIEVRSFDTAGVLQKVFAMSPAPGVPDYITGNGGKGWLFTATAQGTDLGIGPHQYRFYAAVKRPNNTVLTEAYLPGAATFYAGPYVNSPPALSAGTMYMPTRGEQPTARTVDFTNPANPVLNPIAPTTISDTYVFRVVYKDADAAGLSAPSFNTPRSFARLITNIPGMASVDMAVVSGSPEQAGGAIMETTPLTLPAGKWTFHFAASDKYGATDLDPARFPTTATEISGLDVRSLVVLTAPTPGVGPVDGTVVPAPVGAFKDTYAFSAYYKHADGTAPKSGFPVLKVYDAAGTTLQASYPMVATSPANPTANDYKTANGGKGVLYTYSLSGATFVSGDHKFLINATDPEQVSQDWLPHGGATKYDEYVNFPPSLAGGTAYIQSKGAASAPVWNATTGRPDKTIIGTTSDSYIFRVIYKDTDPTQTPVSYVRVVTNIPSIGANGTVQMSLVSGSPSDPAGAIYETAALTLPSANNDDTKWKFHYEASDKAGTTDLDQARFIATGEMSGLDVRSVVQLTPPVNNPATNDGTVVPLVGPFVQNYVFTATYTHLDGTAPARIQVLIFAADGTTLQKTYNMVATTPANPTVADFKNGVVYTYTAPGSDLGSGQHQYQLVATDNVSTATLKPGAVNYVGPTVNFVPSLSSPTVYVVNDPTRPGPNNPPVVDQNNVLQPNVIGTVKKQYVFRATYQDPDGVAPTFAAAGNGYVQVKINNNPTTIPMTHMTPNNPTATDWKNGVRFESDPTGLDASPVAKQFHIEAFDGWDTTRIPQNAEITGLINRSVVVLSAPVPDGTLTPIVGPPSKDFVYQVIYTNLDNTPPASVKVIIDEADPNRKVTLTLTKADTGTDFTKGVKYAVTYRFAKTEQNRAHTYRFEAVDQLTADYTGVLPLDGSNLNGPQLNTAFFTTTPSPLGPGTVGTPVTIVGQLNTNPGVITVPRTVVVQLVKPDGSGVNENLNIATADGSFTYTSSATLDQTGDWQAKFIWDGIPGSFDAVTATFPFTVKGFTLAENAGDLDMISSPFIPVTQDPGITFSPTKPDGVTPLSVTVLDLVVWVATAQPTARYFSLNFDAGFPAIQGGQGFWVNPSQAVILNPRGKLWDRTQPYAIGLPVGWSIVGSVFLQPVTFGSLTVRTNGTEVSILAPQSPVKPYAWGYNKSTGAYQLLQANDQIIAGKAYWFRATAPCELVLQPPSTKAATILRSADIKANALQMTARAGNHIDLDNYIPLDPTARTRAAQIEKPPYMGDYVTVQFVAADGIKLPSDTRLATGQSVVAFEVQTNLKNTDVTVQFPNVATLGRRYSITAIDLTSNQKRSIGNGGGLSYNTGDNATPRRFALVMGQATLSGRLMITDVHTTSRAAGAMVVTYSVTTDATVQADVIGATGAVLRNLSSGRAATAGANTILWDGKNGNGVSMPAGSYLLRVKATDGQGSVATYSQPVILVR